MDDFYCYTHGNPVDAVAIIVIKVFHIYPPVLLALALQLDQNYLFTTIYGGNKSQINYFNFLLKNR